jgi:hypothetical protein
MKKTLKIQWDCSFKDKSFYFLCEKNRPKLGLACLVSLVFCYQNLS